MITPADRAVVWLAWRRSRIAVLGALALGAAFPLVLTAVAALKVEFPGRSRPLAFEEVTDLCQFFLVLLVLPLFSGILGVLATSGSAPGRDSWIARQPLAPARTWLVRTATGLLLTAGILATGLLLVSWLEPTDVDAQFRTLVYVAAVMGAMGFGAGLLGGTLTTGARAGLVALGYWGAAFGTSAYIAPRYFWMDRPILAMVIAGFGITALLATLVTELRAEPLGRHRSAIAVGTTAACLLVLIAGLLPGAAALDRHLLPASVPCESFPLPTGHAALLRFFRFDGARSWVVDAGVAERVLSLAPGHAHAAAHRRRPWLALAVPAGFHKQRSEVDIVIVDISQRPARKIGTWSWPQDGPPARLLWAGDRLVTLANRELLVFEKPFSAPPRHLPTAGRGWTRLHRAASDEEVLLVSNEAVRGTVITRVSLATGRVVGTQLTGVMFGHDIESPSGNRVAGTEPTNARVLDLATGTVTDWPLAGTNDGGPYVLGLPVWLDDEHLAWVVRRGSLTCVDLARVPDPARELTCWVTNHVRLRANPLSGRLIASLDRGEGEASVFDLATRRWQELPPGRMYSWAGRDTLAVQTTTGGIGFAELATPDQVRWLQEP